MQGGSRGQIVRKLTTSLYFNKQIPKQPSITSKRQEENKIHKNEKIKFTLKQKQLNEAIKKKRELMNKNRKQNIQRDVKRHERNSRKRFSCNDVEHGHTNPHASNAT